MIVRYYYIVLGTYEMVPFDAYNLLVDGLASGQNNGRRLRHLSRVADHE
jgi:hypothetical protein